MSTLAEHITTTSRAHRDALNASAQREKNQLRSAVNARIEAAVKAKYFLPVTTSTVTAKVTSISTVMYSYSSGSYVAFEALVTIEGRHFNAKGSIWGGWLRESWPFVTMAVDVTVGEQRLWRTRWLRTPESLAAALG